MEEFIVGDIIVTPFPFSDLKGKKLRPALIVAKAEFGNLILCQITSKAYSSKIAIKLTPVDFSRGTLSLTSYIRPDKLFTAEPSIIKRIAGNLTIEKRQSTLKVLRDIFKSNN